MVAEKMIAWIEAERDKIYDISVTREQAGDVYEGDITRVIAEAYTDLVQRLRAEFSAPTLGDSFRESQFCAANPTHGMCRN